MGEGKKRRGEKEGREKWERKKRDEKVGTLFRSAPLDWDFLCVFGHSKCPFNESDGNSPPPFPSLTVGIPCNSMRQPPMLTTLAS